MHPADHDPQPRPSGQQAGLPSRLDAGTGYREGLARVRARRADERDRVADERDRIADERERVADEREALADRRERAADKREEQLDRARADQGRNPADLSNRGDETLARDIARTARSLAGISRQKSAGQRAEAARRRAQAAAPYWPSRLDSETARAEFLTVVQRQRDTITQAQAAVNMARALCESARETVARLATTRVRRARP